jgi:sugar (pentulose or hexulose) kinase
VLVPDEREATCRGAAALALVAAGEIADLGDAALLNQPRTVRYRHRRSTERAARYSRFETYLTRLFTTDEGNPR